MMKNFAIAAILGVAVAGSSAQAQIRAGVNIGNGWNGVNVGVGTPSYYNNSGYYGGYSNGNYSHGGYSTYSSLSYYYDGGNYGTTVYSNPGTTYYTDPGTV